MKLTFIRCLYLILLKSRVSLFIIKIKGAKMDKPDYEMQAIDREIDNEHERHRNRLEQLRQRKQYLKNSRAKKREQEKRQRSYQECIDELLEILQS